MIESTPAILQAAHGQHHPPEQQFIVSYYSFKKKSN